MSDASVGYLIVYHIEIALLFATLVAIGPLVRANDIGEPRRRATAAILGQRS